MTYDYLKYLKQHSQTLKILNSDNFAFIISFFHFVFIEKRNLTIAHSVLLRYLDDYLYDINQRYDNAFVKSSKEYLDDFSSEQNGYLRKYHDREDEALYELTPHVQKSLEFVEGLEKKEFVGSRSKFNIIFELLEELEFETNLNDDQRIQKLQAQKREIDVQIEAIESKQDLRFDNSRIKEHFMQIEEIVRKLKYDFSEIEYNFRALNIKAMEQIVTQDAAKGIVLGSIFEVEDNIRQSDQGKSFFAFWQLLTDATKSDKLSSLLENVYKIDTIKEFDKDEKLGDLKYSLLQSGGKISKVSSKLIEQLRRFLDDRVWIENRRVLELCKEIQKNAIEIKEDLPKSKNFALIDDACVEINSVFDKSLFTLKEKTEFKNVVMEDDIEIVMDSFYDIFFIDEECLKRNISELLLSQTQCTIKDVVQKFGIKKGLAELITYVSIAKNSASVRVDESLYESIEISDSSGVLKRVKLPKIIFIREQ
jgi:hypothetical protein